jgi:hypothetical protein
MHNQKVSPRVRELVLASSNRHALLLKMAGAESPVPILWNNADMGFRFRRSIKIAPGLRVNLSKAGPSVSFGGRGLTTNVSVRGTRHTVSIPGTGVSYSTKREHSEGTYRRPLGTGRRIGVIFLGCVVLFALLAFLLN